MKVQLELVSEEYFIPHAPPRSITFPSATTFKSFPYLPIATYSYIPWFYCMPEKTKPIIYITSHNCHLCQVNGMNTMDAKSCVLKSVNILSNMCVWKGGGCYLVERLFAKHVNNMPNQDYIPTRGSQEPVIAHLDQSCFQ